MKTYFHKKILYKIFKATLFKGAQNWKHPSIYPHTAEWINNVVSPYIEILLCNKRNELAVHTMARMNLKNIILS